jgi:hypothetical protein
MIITSISDKFGVQMWKGFNILEIGEMAGFCECGNEYSKSECF